MLTPEPDAPEPTPLVRIGTLKQLFGLDRRAVHWLIRSEGFPFIPMKGMNESRWYYFDVADVRRWIESRKTVIARPAALAPAPTMPKGWGWDGISRLKRPRHSVGRNRLPLRGNG